MENAERRIIELENEIAALKALLKKEVKRLDARDTEIEGGICYYIDEHGKEHADITRKVWASYGRTHPEVMDTLIQCDKILGLRN